MDPIVVILFVGLAVIALVMVYTRTYLNIMGADEKCRTTWKVLDAALVLHRGHDHLQRRLRPHCG